MFNSVTYFDRTLYYNGNLKILNNKYGEQAHLLFVGGGEITYTENLKNLVKKKALEKYIHFAGNQNEVRQFYLMADIFTLTSYSIETFSLAALEAMAFGLPCSLTDIGGASEMIVDGLTGALSQPNNSQSIAESWHNLLNSKIKGEQIRQYVIDNFTSGKMLDAYAELIFNT